MQTEATFIEEIKRQYKYGGMTMKLLFVNLAVFLLIQLLFVFARLIGGSTGAEILTFTNAAFSLETDLSAFIYKPWGLFTSIFAHFGLWHCFMNLVFLYFSGKMFEALFDQRRLLYTYILGGIAGGLLEIIAHAIFPALQGSNTVIVGASGSIMAIFTALAFHRPNLQVNLFGIFPVRLIFLAAFFILFDLISLGANDGTAHFAHIGGVLLGMISVQNLYGSGNVITATEKLVNRFRKLFSGIFSSKPKMKVKKGGQTRSTAFKSDEDYALEAKQRQEKIDRILDKISKSGYESLTKQEKEFLFNQSNRN